MCNKNEVHNSFGRTPDFDSQDIPAPSSDTKAWSLEESSINGTGAIYRNWWDRLNFLGPQGSMPMTSDIPSSSTIVPSNKVILEAMARCLLSVTVADTAS